MSTYALTAFKFLGAFCIAATFNLQPAKADVFDLRWGMTVREAETALGEPLKLGPSPSGYTQGIATVTMAGGDFSVGLIFDDDETAPRPKSTTAARRPKLLTFFDMGTPSSCPRLLQYFTDRLGPETSREDRTPTFTVGGSGGPRNPGPLPRWTDYVWDRGDRPQVKVRITSGEACGAVYFERK